MPPRDMTQEDRERLAERLLREQRIRFSGVAKDAYTVAGVNPATWKRAVEAEPIKPHKLIQIVANLWPETTGEWTLIPNLDPDADDGPGRLSDLIEGYVREHPGTTDALIAAHVGVDEATISRWRAHRLAKLPDADELRRLAAFLELDERHVFYAAGWDARYFIERETDSHETGIGA